MSIASRLQARATVLLSAGQQEDARRTLTAVLIRDPHNEVAWSQFTATNPALAERRQLLYRIRQAHPDFQPSAPPAAASPSAPPTADRSAPAPRQPWQWGRLALPATAVALLLIAGWIGVVYGLPAATAVMETMQRTRQENVTLRQQVQQLTQAQQAAQAEQETLRAAQSALQQEVDRLNGRNAALKSEKEQLEAAVTTLQTAYDGLVADYDNLYQTYEQLAANHNQLVGDYNALNSSYTALSSEHERLRSLSIQPPYILVDGRVVHLAFYNRSGEVMNWQVPFEHLEDDIRRGYRARFFDNFFSKLRLDTGNGNTITVPDFQDFVDPEPFRGVMSDLYYQSPSDDAFVREVWHIATQLTTYTNETLEIPRFPLETLLAGGGDCEDSSILVASMLAAAPVNWDIEFVYMDGQFPASPRSLNHVLVYVNTYQQEYWIETTNSQVMEPHPQIVGWYHPAK